MENIVNTATPKAVTATRPARLGTIPELRSGRFGRILNDLTTPAEEKSSVAASTTFGKQAMPRSTRFMSMDIGQRRSAVEAKEFFPMPAAFESTRGTLK